jgi:putative ABC transport system permease protein
MRLRQLRALDHLDDHIRDHIDRETRDNMDRGMSPGEARAAALRKFGNVTRVMEDTRAVWRPVWVEQLVQDVRQGIRMLYRNPGFALVVILTLALAIGLNTVVFSVVNAVLIRPLPYPHADRLVWLTEANSLLKSEMVAGVDYLDWKARATSFDEMVAYGYFPGTLRTETGAQAHWFAQVTSNFWNLSGARAALGGLFAEGDRSVLVLSDSLFESQFARDSRVIGRTVALNGQRVTVAGVLSSGFHFALPQSLQGLGPRGPARKEIDGYILNRLAPGSETRHGPMSIQLVVARLKSGVSPASADAELKEIQARIAQENPGIRYDLQSVRVMPLQEKLVGSARPALLILLGAVVFVLLIACVNIASLLLARAASRRKEIAVRAAIGAGQWRVARQFAGENLALALLGGTAGLLLARSAVALLARSAPQAVPRLGEANLDWRVALFALGITVAVGTLTGISPAVSLWRAGFLEDLKQGGKTSGAAGPGLRLRRLLVAAEMALAIILLTGAGLLIHSFLRMNAHPPGFDPERTLSVQLMLTGPRYQALPQQQAFYRDLLSRIQGLPGVFGAGVTYTPIHGLMRKEGDPMQLSAPSRVGAYTVVSPGFARVLGIRLMKGRWLTDAEATPAVMINESCARLLFGNSNPIGRRIAVPLLAPGLQDTLAPVVGIVGDLKYTRLDADPDPEVYLPYLKTTFLTGAPLMVRTTGDASWIAPAVRSQITGMDATQTPGEMRTLQDSLTEMIAPRRFNLFLFGIFAAAALLLALVGIYGVMAYAVTQRTHEIGVRAALGARQSQMVWLVVRQSMRVALAGVCVGLFAALGLTRLMASLLYEVNPFDPVSYAAVSLILIATALVASWIPARVAARVDPLVALRFE